MPLLTRQNDIEIASPNYTDRTKRKDSKGWTQNFVFPEQNDDHLQPWTEFF
jgi:hypothetical protein